MKEVKLVRKIKRLLKRAKTPRWLHRFGPKKYEFYQHCLALLVREFCKLSYRKTAALLESLGLIVPTYSALAKSIKRIPLALWRTLLAATIQFKQTLVAAIDGTYYARVNPCFHYLKRCKRKLPLKNAVQTTALLDTRRKKWLAFKTRLVRRHESKDFKPVVDASTISLLKIVADKASDVEEIHKYCTRKNIEPHIPVRAGVRKGVQRRKHLMFFRKQTYHRRSIIESAFSRLKRLNGGFVKNKGCHAIKAEVALKFLNDNLNLLKEFFLCYSEIFNNAGESVTYFS